MSSVTGSCSQKFTSSHSSPNEFDKLSFDKLHSNALVIKGFDVTLGSKDNTNENA